VKVHELSLGNLSKWLLVRQSNLVMVADWFEQLGHGSRLVRAIGSW